LEYLPDGIQTTRIVLVNDSPNTIEAIRLAHECSLMRLSMNTDVLDSPDYSRMIRDAAGNPAQSIGPDPDGTWELEVFDNSERPKYVGECAPRVEFILFYDGSNEGKESEVRVLKARRDGEFASIIEWLEIFNRQEADRVDVAGLSELAIRRQDNNSDRGETYAHQYQSAGDEGSALAFYFWSAKWSVDVDVAFFLRYPQSRPPEQAFQNEKDRLEKWTNKFDTDPAMKRLREVFPPSVPDKPVDKRDPS
jgi:hypothetical protein